jgi:hypothetical protein
MSVLTRRREGIERCSRLIRTTNSMTSDRQDNARNRCTRGGTATPAISGELALLIRFG